MSGSDVPFWATCLSTAAAFAALGVAGITFRRANLNASASTHLQLNVEIRTGADRLRSAANLEDYRVALIELLRVLEIACAICNEGTLKGVS